MVKKGQRSISFITVHDRLNYIVTRHQISLTCMIESETQQFDRSKSVFKMRTLMGQKFYGNWKTIHEKQNKTCVNKNFMIVKDNAWKSKASALFEWTVHIKSLSCFIHEVIQQWST